MGRRLTRLQRVTCRWVSKEYAHEQAEKKKERGDFLVLGYNGTQARCYPYHVCAYVVYTTQIWGLCEVWRRSAVHAFDSSDCRPR